MTKEQMIPAFNEWMRRYVEDPKSFEAEFQTVTKFVAEASEGREPTYGETSVAYLESLVSEIAG